MSEPMERYMYEVRPYKPISNLIPGKTIWRAQTLKLTKEEVIKCMNNAHVYRHFPGKPLIKVTKSNLDELHVSSLEGKKEKVPYDKTENTVEAPISEVELPEEPKTEALTDEKIEETDVETPVEESTEEDEVVENTAVEEPVEEDDSFVEDAEGEKELKAPVPLFSEVDKQNSQNNDSPEELSPIDINEDDTEEPQQQNGNQQFSRKKKHNRH